MSTGTTEFEVSSAECLRDAFGYIDNTAYDVILLDLRLPDSYGFDTFARIQAHAPTIPVTR